MIRSDNSLRIVVLSGPVSAGKSTISNLLRERYGAQVVRTRDFIKERSPRVKDERRSLQRAGEKLDRADNGAWVREGLVRVIEGAQTGTVPTGLFVVDSVRIPGQIEAIRQAYGPAVHHVHLYAGDDELRSRYQQKGQRTRELPDYSEVQRNKTERAIVGLADLADLVVATDRCLPAAVLVRATALLGLYSRNTTPLVDVLVGGQYGSEGKGNIVGYIAPEYELLVRVGGPNAGHQVYREPDPEVYHHLPSGTGRAPNAQLLLGAGAVLYPPGLIAEINEHNVSAERLSIDPHAMIIEDADKALEQELLASIGSTTQGVGAASARKIMGRGGKSDPVVRLAKHVPELKLYIRDTQEILERAFVQGTHVLLEGTQGTTLSIHHGDYPHVTSRDTTVAGCLADAGIAVTRVRRVLMVCRTYPIRVANPGIDGQTSGPMASPVTYEELSERSGIPVEPLMKIETTTTTRRQRRVAAFDWEQFAPVDLFEWPDRYRADVRRLPRYREQKGISVRAAYARDTTLYRGGRTGVRCPGQSHIDEFQLEKRHRQARVVTDAELEELLSDCPTLYHMAEDASWPSIRERGLLSTTALLDLYGSQGAEREQVEAQRRPAGVVLEHASLPRAVIRDQLPMDDGGLRRCLPGHIEPTDWYRLLNGKVFFWLTRRRLLTLLNARPYRRRPHDVIELSTRRLVERHYDHIWFCPMNSGCTKPIPHPRNDHTFERIPDYDYAGRRRSRRRDDRVVELAVDYSVPDISDFVIRVVQMQGREELGILPL